MELDHPTTATLGVVLPCHPRTLIHVNIIPMVKKKYRPFLRAFSGLSINISAAWFAVPFIGTSIAFPNDLLSFRTLIASILFGILFLLVTVWFERKLEK